MEEALIRLITICVASMTYIGSIICQRWQLPVPQICTIDEQAASIRDVTFAPSLIQRSKSLHFVEPLLTDQSVLRPQ